METWKPALGFDDYLISDSGKVWNLKSNKIATGYINGGYMTISLFQKKKKYTCKIHRLVATAFIDNPGNKPHIHHINADKLDNRPDNLMWVTQQEHGKLTELAPDHLEKCRERKRVRDAAKEAKRIATRARVDEIIKIMAERKDENVIVCHI